MGNEKEVDPLSLSLSLKERSRTYLLLISLHQF